MPNNPNAPLNYFTWGGDLKSVTDQGLLSGDGIVFGSEKEHDLSQYKDFFTSDTFIHPEDKFTTALFMEHGFSYRNPIGKAILYKTDKGWEVTAELDLTNPVVKSRFPEIKQGGWGFSTGAVGHVVEREKKDNGTHHIKQWAVGEISITKTPAEPKALIRSVKSLDEYYNVGPEMEDEMEEESTNMMTDEQRKEMMRAVMSELMMELMAKLMDKKHNEFLLPELEEIKTLIKEIKTPDDGSGEPTEELTVLKSENEELKSSFEELQSSFNEKEALLSEKMALLSEVQEELELKNESINLQNETLEKANADIEELKQEIEKVKKINLALGDTNFNK